jgi:hypothetical protein
MLGEAGSLFVFVQSDTDELIYERKPVVVGMKDDRYAEIIEGVFPTDKVVVDGNYQLQYVAATKPAPKPAESGGTNAPAATAHTESNAGAVTSPLLWMGITVAVLLFVNALLLLLKKRKPAGSASTAATTEETPTRAAATDGGHPAPAPREAPAK